MEMTLVPCCAHQLQVPFHCCPHHSCQFCVDLGM
jgi:hypothetical protein